MIFTQEAPLTRKWFSGRSCIRSNWNKLGVNFWFLIIQGHRWPLRANQWHSLEERHKPIAGCVIQSYENEWPCIPWSSSITSTPRCHHFTVLCLVAWPLNENETVGELVLIEISLLFLCKLLLIRKVVYGYSFSCNRFCTFTRWHLVRYFKCLSFSFF